MARLIAEALGVTVESAGLAVGRLDWNGATTLLVKCDWVGLIVGPRYRDGRQTRISIL